MSIIIIIISAFIAAGLTFFSGFGLATVLTPVFIVFFPVPIAIGLTAIVHFSNNLFKFFLVRKKGNSEVILKFGLSAMVGALFGSFTLLMIVKKSTMIHYSLFEHTFNVEFINLTIGLLILLFVILELLPQGKTAFDKKMLSVGGYLNGFLSGFFGGLSGHQGAFRSIFLLKCDLSAEQFIATGIIIALMVDIVRLPFYGISFLNNEVMQKLTLIVLAVIFAFLGSFLANKYMQKVTIKFVRNTVALLLFVVSIGLITGLI